MTSDTGHADMTESDIDFLKATASLLRHGSHTQVLMGRTATARELDRISDEALSPGGGGIRSRSHVVETVT